MALVPRARCSFRGEDAGRVNSHKLLAQPRTLPRGEQRGLGAQTLFRQSLLYAWRSAEPGGRRKRAVAIAGTSAP